MSEKVVHLNNNDEGSLDAKAVVDRMRNITKAKSDIALASLLGVPDATLNTWKKRNSIPLRILISFSRHHHASLDWLVGGSEHSTYKGKDTKHASTQSINRKNLRIALYSIFMPISHRLFPSLEGVKINRDINPIADPDVRRAYSYAITRHLTHEIAEIYDACTRDDKEQNDKNSNIDA